MKKGLMFGCAYYPEYLPKELLESRSETDIAWMKEAGMNEIRIAESTWSTWEPEEGVFDFSILNQTLDLCEKYEMGVIIGTPTYAVPAWLIKKAPEIQVETKEGRIPYGRRQSMDIFHPVYRFHAERIIRKLCEEVQNRICVIGFQLDNETKHYDTVSKYAQEAFIKSLKEKFGDIRDLNDAFGLAYWSNGIADWEDFPDVRGTINGSLASAFDTFRRKAAADFLLWQRKIVDEYRAPEQFVTQNFDFGWRKVADPKDPDGFSYGIQDGISHLEGDKALTLSGVDIYHPSQNALTGEEIAFGGDSIRVLKDQPYMVLETEAQAFKSTVPFPGQLKLQAVSHLASGACGVNYWHWSSIHNACESYWKGILSHDLLKNRIYEEVREIGQAFKKLSPELTGFHKKNRAALVISHTAKSATEWFPVAEGRSYNDVVMEYYRALYRQNIECDVIEAEALKERIYRYRMVVTPVLYAVSEEAAGCLRDFVQNGGVLVSSMRSFVCDENIKIYHEALPYHLTDVFGMTYQEHTAPENVMIAGKPVKNIAELLITGKADALYHYEHPYWDKYTGVTENTFGKGKAFYIGCDVPFELLSSLLRKAANAAEIVSVWKESFPVIIREGISAKEKKVTFLLNYSGEKKRVLWRGDKARELMTGKTVEEEEEILLSEWGCQIWKAL